MLAVLVIAVPPPTATGSRAFSKIESRESFMRTLEIYTPRDQVTQRILCVSVDDLQLVQEKYAANLGFLGVNVATGGPDWFGVVSRGLEKLNGDIETVIIHDASRPAVPYTLIDDLEAAFAKPNTAGVIPVLPARGTFATQNNDGTLGEFLDMSGSHDVQSPQIYKRSLLQAAYARRKSLETPPVDDSELLLHAGVLGKEKLRTIQGSFFNQRIENDDALRLAADLLSHLPKPRSKTPITPFDEAQW